jgi:hypothetical protein
MKSDLLTRLLTLFSLSLLSMSAHAAQWYHVEVIVFEQLSTVTDEQWPIMPEIEKGELALSDNNQFIHPAAVETLIESEQRLSRSSNYRVHYHHAWQQPINRKGSSAKAVTIESANGMVAGNIRLYKSTYLHAAVDLWLLENQIAISSWSDASPQGESFIIDSEGEPVNTIRNPHLIQSHRIRSKKLHFFDHPKFGVLLQLTPIETPTAIQATQKALETFSLPAEAPPISSQ